MGLLAGSTEGWLGALSVRLFTPVPAQIRDAYRLDQYHNVRHHIPTLHLVAILNLFIIDFVLWHEGVPITLYMWTPLLLVVSVWRLFDWHRQRNAKGETTPQSALEYLVETNRATLMTVTMASLFSAWSFYAGLISYPVLIPVSLAFGVFAIAQCLAPLRFASLVALVIGIFPSSLIMAFSGDFLSMALGFSAMSVAILKLSFLREYHGGTVARLLLELKIRDLADRDPLTGLFNRRALRDVLERKLTSADARSRFGVAMIDLDGFKSVNDQRGHHAGDELLQLVAERLLTQAGPEAVVARIGGDEFIVILNDELGGPGMAARMSGLIACLAKPARIDGVRTHIAASLGYALFPESGQDFDALLRSADEALYAAKGDGKARARGPMRLVHVKGD